MFQIFQVSILEWFLKDHVTLKSNDAENSALPSQQEKGKHILKYIKTE